MTRFDFPIRVYWEDTDAGGIVFYANYLKFFERARTEWLRAAGVEQQRLREQTGVMFVVADTRLRYLAPARLDDLLNITVATEFQRQGWARVLLDALALWSRGRGAQWLWLEVRASNLRAQHIYEAHGYRRVGERKRYYP
ncbi:YbgC/FadM family acyl-CoA thioesterase, partial [Escherichia coli]|uniref:YbgC/FadM family acyl-CoA thioesterase n=1 Tax=Escherichia coli TaxID=562 RepID=UPI001BC8BCF8